jgi:DNA repair exonuclease SbcCD nuclease subunit
MKFVVTADWHIQNSGMFSQPLSEGMTTRAKESFDFIDWLDEWCKENEIHAVFHCGDFFTQKNMINIPLFNKTYERMNRFYHVVIAIPGNHDRYLKAHAVHSLYTLGKGIYDFNVLDEDRRHLIIGDVEVYGLPGGAPTDAYEIPDKKATNRRLFLIHENLIGAKFPAGAKITDGLDPRYLQMVLKKAKFDWCFSGDIHKSQYVRKSKPPVVYVGAPFQMDFGDEGQERGIWSYDSATNVAEFVEYPNGPKFETITDYKWHRRRDEIVSNLTTMDGRPYYYKFRFEEMRLVDQVRSLFEGYEDRYVMDPIAKSESEGSSFSALHNPSELVDEWCSINKEEIGALGLDKAEVVAMGKEFLARVGHKEG